MHDIKNILLIYGSEHTTIPWVGDFARTHQADLAIWQNVRIVSRGINRFHRSTDKKPTDITQLIVQDQLKDLHKLVQSLNKTGSHVTTRVISRDLAGEITADVWRNHRDLVVVPYSDFVQFGRSISKLFGSFPIPVLILKPNMPQHQRKVLVILDDCETVKETIFRQCAGLLAGDDILFLHTWKRSGLEDFEGKRGIAAAALQSAATEETLARTQNLRRIISERGIGNSNVKVQQGNRMRVILDTIASDSIDLVMIETEEPQGIFSLLHRRRTEKMIFRMNCSVLVTPPNRFVETDAS